MKFNKLLIAGVTTLAMAGNIAQASENWKMPVALPSTLPGIGGAYSYFTNAINKGSGGEIRVKTFDPGTLISGAAVLDAVKAGKYPAGFAVTAYSAGTIPAASLLMAQPFGLSSAEFISWYHSGGGKSLAQELFNENGLQGFLCQIIDAEPAGWFNKEINSIDDFKGLKFRTAGYGGHVMQRLGASVTGMPTGEVFQALEKGTIDAADVINPGVDVVLKINTVADTLYFPSWHSTMGAAYMIVNKGVWDGLTERNQVLIETACDAATTYNLADTTVVQAKALKTLKEYGTKFKHFPDSVVEALREATNEVMTAEAAKDPQFKVIYESMMAFKESQKDWSKLKVIP